MQPDNVIQDDDIYALTERGESQLRGGATQLARQHIELLVLLDGQATVRQLLEQVSLPREQFVVRLKELLDENLIKLFHSMPSDSLDFTGFLSMTPAPQPSPGALSAASREAPAGEAALKERGYYVSIARTATMPRVLKPDERLKALVIEDEPHLGKLLRTYLGFEKFDALVATNREEIVTAFQQIARPDFVLLDVMLPDVDGFDVLAKMRRHPILKKVPVIMLTAKASREAVLRGLATGADGYITKPFNVENLLRAVRSVLGLPQPQSKPSSPFDAN